MKSVLHVGVIIDSFTPDNWVAELIRRAQERSCLRLTVGIRPVSHSHPAQLTAPAKLASYVLNKYIDKPLFTHDPKKATALPCNISHYLLSENISQFNTCDVIVLLSEYPLERRYRKQLDIDIWHAALGSLTLNIEFALLQRSPFIWLSLYKMSPSDFTDESQTIENLPISRHALPCQTFSLSDLNRLAYSSLPSFILSRLTWMALRSGTCNELRDRICDASSVFPNEIQPAAHPNAKDFQHRIGGLHYLSLVSKLLWCQSKQRVNNYLLQEQWQLAFSQQTTTESEGAEVMGNTSVASYQAVAETKDVMWADPHLCEHNGFIYVFFEHKKHHADKGQINFIRLDDNGNIIESGTAMKACHHLSYPFVFTDENQHYMIPETAGQQKVTLFRATDFPHQWQIVSNLLQGVDAADSTLYKHEGKWWMFTNCLSHRCVDERDELHLYYADQLEGPWLPHPLNPVITGVDRARMAGPIVERDGRLYRISQYGAYRYGYGINVSQITELSTDEYRESACEQILPTGRDGWQACHSLVQLKGLRIIDRMRMSWR